MSEIKLDAATRERIANALIDRMRIYNFVHVFDDHMPELMTLIRKTINETLENFGYDPTVSIVEDMFSGVLKEYTWLKPYCFLYLETQSKKIKKFKV